MFSIAGIDLLEQELLDNERTLLEILLQDKTTKKNIIWATDDYAELGEPYSFKKEILPEQKGMFFVQSFFELFEVLLSYLSNTLSFLRIGAFAVSHAAMMEVVLMLAGATNGGSPNWIVVVLGNIFVCAMEGLIVGIQVLRLEYYEIFSRFYAGNGREFKPFMKAAHKN